jgi:hypothetical protein
MWWEAPWGFSQIYLAIREDSQEYLEIMSFWKMITHRFDGEEWI